MNVYARTTVTRELIEIDRDGTESLAWIEGQPVRRQSVGPWTFLGPVQSFVEASALARAKADEDTRGAFREDLARGRVLAEARRTTVVASAAGPRGLQWFGYHRAGREGAARWTTIQNP